MYKFNLFGRSGAEADASAAESRQQDRMKRIDEQKKLTGLNERLSECLQERHKLESANAQLCQELEDRDERSRAAYDSLKATYEKELEKVRRELEELRDTNEALHTQNDNLKDSNKRLDLDVFCQIACISRYK